MGRGSDTVPTGPRASSWSPGRTAVVCSPTRCVEYIVGRWRLLGRVALRLPMKQIVRDEVILVHRSRRIFVFGLLQRHKEDIEFTVL